jgi:DNA-binding NtrC family response regulator
MKRKIRILVVDDAPDTVELIRRNLEFFGHRVWTAAHVRGAIALWEEQDFDLVITDWKMPEHSGMDLVRFIRERDSVIGILMVTGYASIEGAVNAVHTGVDEYLPKPFTDDDLRAAVDKALEKVATRQTVHNTTAEPESSYGIIGRSQEMRAVFAAIEKAAKSNATVLITGESGTGKELVARAIHYQGKRHSAPFVPINCSAIPQELIESELFGYVKGAFTGALANRPGFFQTANGGSLFLDEIGEMNLGMQSKLLRVIQEKEISQLGSRRTQTIDVRYIAATNKDLRVLVDKGAFRGDLFYRLNIVTIDLPPLNHRPEDVPILIRHFASRFAAETGKPAPRFSDAVLDILTHYDWPGNVRELENLVLRLLVMLDKDTVEPADLPVAMRTSHIHGSNGALRTLAEVEIEHIRFVVQAVRGNISEAARVLDIDRKTLRQKLEKSEKPEP